MVFNAKTQRGWLWFLLALNIFSILIYPDEILYVQIILVAFILFCLFVTFKFTIVEETLLFEMLIFKKAIYRKEVHPEQIIGMKFKRVGWGKKCAVIQTTKGFNLRIINFYPEKVYADLIDYANQYDISIVKSKDYLIIERLDLNHS